MTPNAGLPPSSAAGNGVGARAGRFRATTLAAWAMWAVMLVFVVGGIATAGPGGATDLYSALISGLGALSASAVGAILVTRFPRNAIGWLLCLGGLGGGLTLGTSGLAYYGLVTQPGSLPGAIWLAWLSNWTWTPYLVCLAFFLPLLFPTGHLPSSRWRVVAAAGVVAIVAGSIHGAFSPMSGSPSPSLQNPLALTGWAANVLSLVSSGVTLIGIVCLPFAAGSLVVRYRRSSGIERQQLKWFAYVVALMAPALAVGLILSNYSSGVLGTISTAAWLTVTIGLGLLPVAIGLAVMRYRLYAIDLVIRRTLVYGALAALLGAAYVGSVLLLSAVLAPITSGNSLAVAASTLLVAGLFQPVRRRIQSRVDRRFYRSRYDATRELAAFGARLRDQVDLAQVSTDVSATVERLIQPESVSLWLRERGL